MNERLPDTSLNDPTAGISAESVPSAPEPETLEFAPPAPESNEVTSITEPPLPLNLVQISSAAPNQQQEPISPAGALVVPPPPPRPDFDTPPRERPSPTQLPTERQESSAQPSARPSTSQFQEGM